MPLRHQHPTSWYSNRVEHLLLWALCTRRSDAGPLTFHSLRALDVGEKAQGWKGPPVETQLMGFLSEVKREFILIRCI